MVSGHALRSGRSKSCGCLAREIVGQNATKHGALRSNAKDSDNKLYRVWQSMRSRCKTQSNTAYKWYGGKGVKVCAEWDNDFESFLEWSYKNGYKPGLSIDRIRCDGDYCPDNCRWVGRAIQDNNRTDNHYIEYNGETHTMTEWARITGINVNTLSGRINRYGWPIKDALTIEVWGAYHSGDKKEEN